MHRLLILLLFALPVTGRTLHWRSLDVQARLDGDGHLHVIERQRMVFDGDWNGGERTLNPRGRQRVEVHRLSRIEEGREIPLQRGGLDAVDHYEVSRKGVVRWRSRLPTDPPFDQRELTYILDYTYRNVLESEEGRFVLAHDFGLPERSGVIDRFTLLLTFDPVWNTGAVSEHRAALEPGHSVTVRRSLDHAAGIKPPAYFGGHAVLVAFAIAVGWLLFHFVRDEKSRGRFAPVKGVLDPALLELRPEAVGTIWDAEVGAPEVAATLARMTQEGKIVSHVNGKDLFMRLVTPQHELSGYERLLVAKLFFGGNETDTKRIRRHYKGSGVDFAALIRPGVETAVTSAIPGWDRKTKRFAVRSHLISLAAAALLLGGPGLFGHPEDFGEAIIILAVGAVFGLLACLVAYGKSRSIESFAAALAVPSLLLMFPTALLILGALRAYPGGRLSLPVLIACAIWILAITRLMLDLLRTREGREVIEARQRTLALRKYFLEQLRLPGPDLRDQWFPYLLAFGLGKHADRWFRSFGHASAASSFGSSDGAGSSTSSSSASWSGGGGAFGGAGATGSWAMAATAIGAGVASPSSSGGGSSSGSSSGGGGGGGW